MTWYISNGNISTQLTPVARFEWSKTKWVIDIEWYFSTFIVLIMNSGIARPFILYLELCTYTTSHDKYPSQNEKYLSQIEKQESILMQSWVLEYIDAILSTWVLMQSWARAGVNCIQFRISPSETIPVPTLLPTLPLLLPPPPPPPPLPPVPEARWTLFESSIPVPPNRKSEFVVVVVVIVVVRKSFNSHSRERVSSTEELHLCGSLRKDACIWSRAVPASPCENTWENTTKLPSSRRR